uniref:Glutamine synthetase leaf isozyme, chloroplastic n=1 Tax=Tanacetum cinerariifolium TaxID=118510 RepID=A0A699HF06_TANCI|nr:glutamine synthetase leaf isozyme, chloroplastic [Tanacetum cinerariifolium]
MYTLQKNAIYSGAKVALHLLMSGQLFSGTKSFLTKIFKLLRNNVLHCKYICAFALDGFDPLDDSQRMKVEDLLKLDVTPYTDKIILKYIWSVGVGPDTGNKSRNLKTS